MKTKIKKIVVLALLGLFLAESAVTVKTMAAQNPAVLELCSDKDVTPVSA